MTTPTPIDGLHHVTAITADTQKNIHFYSNVLGLRLVKLTVNFDDPSSYHLYYGDGLGRPGTIMTFFSWPGAITGRVGSSHVTAVAFAVPKNALGYWNDRLRHNGIEPQPQVTQFGEQVLIFSDPDGIQLELVATDDLPGELWTEGPVSAENAIRGFHHVTLTERDRASTAMLLTKMMGYVPVGFEENRYRYRSAAGGVGSYLDVLEAPSERPGTLGAGVVHHVAFRTPDDATQKVWQSALQARYLRVSPVMDRNYFHSIYFREPGGVLFEIATNGPGFAVDEAPEKLGTSLKLPAQYESSRAEIERALPPVQLPSVGAKS